MLLLWCCTFTVSKRKRKASTGASEGRDRGAGAGQSAGKAARGPTTNQQAPGRAAPSRASTSGFVPLSAPALASPAFAGELAGGRNKSISPGDRMGTPLHRMGVPMDPQLMQEMTEFDYTSPTQPSRRSMMSPLGVSQMM